MRIALLAAALGFAGLATPAFVPPAFALADNIVFDMVPTGGGEPCIPRAAGRVTITSFGSVENMHVEVSGLPPSTDFDLFAIQVPNAPFGMAWYLGDIETNNKGFGVNDFTGRFSIETFTIAVGSIHSPVVSGHKDASSNPVTGPATAGAIQQYHLGLWFNSPADAGKAGCATTQTPFNGTQSAGVQILNTSNFPDLNGPLRRVR
jgi:hypothetical protein